MASGSVTPGTVEETVLGPLSDTPDLQRLYRDRRAIRDSPHIPDTPLDLDVRPETGDGQERSVPCTEVPVGATM